MMIRIQLLICFTVFSTLFSGVFAQVRLHPAPRHADYFSPARGARPEEDDTTKIKLPFFEDFSTSLNQPDTARWFRNGGVLINNGFGINPPSFNVATFDGLDYTGAPYDFENVTRAGEADQLVSRMIDLSGVKSGDKLVLSFFWQSQGRGEKPDADDYILLEFRNKDGQWIEKWRQAGGLGQTPFAFVGIAVTEFHFLHRAFQFRFRNVSRLSGAYDTWNIDHIYLNTDRVPTNRSIPDITISTPPVSLLKNYRAMPIKQFYANFPGEIRDTITATLNNLDERFNVISYDMEMRELIRNQWLGVVNSGSDLLTGFTQQHVIRAFMRDSIQRFRERLIPMNRDRMILQYRFRVNTNEDDNTLPGVRLRNNDTLAGTVVLDNYYAYDDGSAEYGVAISQKYGKLAYRFELNVPDVLTHVDINFVPLYTNLRGETFNLYIWKKINLDQPGGNRDSVALVQNILLRYADSINKFTRIELARQISLPKGEFYIGFEQLTDKDLTIGFDKNTDSGNKIYVNATNAWVQNTQIKGSLLLRPVFGVNKPTGLDDKKWETLKVNIYPNPTTGLLMIEGQVGDVVLMDQTGRVVVERTFSPFDTEKSLSLDHLPAGMYFLHMVNGQQRAVKKVVLAK